MGDIDITDVLEGLKEELTCSICHQILREPKSLPCLHSFCEECLERHVRTRHLDEELDPPDTRDVVPCPNCNFRAQLDESGSFRTNHCLKNLVRHYELGQEVVGQSQKSGKSRCGFCSEADNEAVAFCQTRCNQFLCNVCLQAHKRMTHTLQHKIVSLKEVRLTAQAQGSSSEPKPILLAYKTRKCGKHFMKGRDDPNERMTDLIMYCHDCSEVICCMCALTEHQPHSKNDAKIVIDEPNHRPQIETEVRETEETRENVEISAVKLHERKFHIEDARSTTEKDIMARYTRLNSELEKGKESLLNSIDKMHRLHTRRLENQREELDKNRKAIEHVMKFVQCRLHLGSPEDTVHLAKEMIWRMTSLVDEAKQHPPEYAYCREVTFVQEDTNLAGIMGNVTAEPCVDIFTADDINRVEFVRNWDAEFTITARDVLENEASTDDEMVSVELCPVGQPESEVVKASVKRLQNGKCLVTLRPQQNGPHKLKIQVAKAGEFRHIKDSPFDVNVVFQPAGHLWEIRV